MRLIVWIMFALSLIWADEFSYEVEVVGGTGVTIDVTFRTDGYNYVDEYVIRSAFTSDDHDTHSPFIEYTVTSNHVADIYIRIYKNGKVYRTKIHRRTINAEGRLE
jgi:hypothetical protein